MTRSRNVLGSLASVLCLSLLPPAVRAVPSPDERAAEDPVDEELIGDATAIASFLASGHGSLHADAPPETRAFGQLVGLWEGEQEMRGRDGSWSVVSHGLWAWKYVMDGFAVRDLWFQGADALPPYMAGLGRDYLLSAVRVYDARAKEWRVAWMSNAAGETPGGDFGTFQATAEGDRITMTTAPDPRFGRQRIVFSEITAESFLWTSEYSMDDGKSWQASMRMRLSRLR